MQSKPGLQAQRDQAPVVCAVVAGGFVRLIPSRNGIDPMTPVKEISVQVTLGVARALHVNC